VLIEVFIKVPVLLHFDPSKLICLVIDVSRFAICSILHQCKGCWDVQPGRPDEVPVVCLPSVPRISRGRLGSWIYGYPYRQGTVRVP
jgi:hypothetical protein